MDPDFTPIPSDFICPILQVMMDDPVITVDGHTFERKAIEEWFSRGNRTNPMTGLDLEAKVLIPNIALKNVINEFKQKMPKMQKDAE